MMIVAEFSFLLYKTHFMELKAKAMELDPEIAQDQGKDIICLEEDEDRTVEKENTEITENIEIIVENVVVVVKETTEEKKSIMMIDTNIVNLKEVENDLQEMTP